MPAAHRVPWILILLAVTLCVKAQQRSELPLDDAGQTLHVNVDLVTIAVRVSDRKGREVTGLKQEEFSIFEDRKRQQIAVFAVAPHLIGRLFGNSHAANTIGPRIAVQYSHRLVQHAY